MIQERKVIQDQEKIRISSISRSSNASPSLALHSCKSRRVPEYAWEKERNQQRKKKAPRGLLYRGPPSQYQKHCLGMVILVIVVMSNV